MEIEDRRYEELLAAEQASKRVPDLEQKLQTAEEARDSAVRDQEASETAKVAAETERDETKRKLTDAEEKANQAELQSTRIEGLGSEFLGKLGDKTRERLNEQAKSMSDDEWTGRLEELSEMTKVEPTKNKDGDDKDDEVSREEVASSTVTRGGNGNDDGGEISTESRQTVVGKLFAGAKS